MIRCRAESVPMVISVPQKSLSIEPTIPTMFRWDEFLACSSVILPAVKNKQMKKILNQSLPVHMYTCIMANTKELF